MKRLNAILLAASKRQDVVLVGVMMTAVFMMILPLPTILVDALIALNIMLSVMIMTIAIYIRNPLDFVVFPSLLLITTLYRLALTITTSRLILLQHDAGDIVYAFGNFVVGGNVAVGIIVFTIITIVQFIVITKGAERVAEVTARFTLDGMPGKQMSIDGDLRAGAITVEEAKHGRELLQRESRLYGAMDGAMKFVKGDAIASIIVVLVNIVGGIAIGMMQYDMSAGQALSTYAVLSVGDGLIAQIPALLISITAGLVVTRIPTNTEQNLAEQMVEEITRQPWVMLISGLVLTVFAVIPGFPTTIFGTLALLVFGLWYHLRRRAKLASTQAKPVVGPRTSKQAIASTLATPLTVSVGLEAADPTLLTAAVARFCDRKFDELGLQLPLPQVIQNAELPSNAVEIKLYGIPVISFTIPEDAGLVWVSAHLLGDVVQEDRLQWGIPLAWVSPAKQTELTAAGVPVYLAEECIVELLNAVVERYAEDFIGVQETRTLLDAVDSQYPELIRELQRCIAIHKTSEILQRLVSEKVSIRDLRSVFEAMVDWSSKEKDVVLLTEYVRISLRRQICHSFSGPKRRISALLIGERIETMVRESIRETSVGTYSALEAEKTTAIIKLIREHLDKLDASIQPVLLTAMDVRRYIRKMIERDFFRLSVLSTQEMMEDVDVQVLANLELFDERLSYEAA